MTTMHCLDLAFLRASPATPKKPAELVVTVAGDKRVAFVKKMTRKDLLMLAADALDLCRK